MTRSQSTIEQRALGSGATSILGLGTRRLAAAGQQATIRLVRTAIDNGVTLIELAPEYRELSSRGGR